MSSGFSRTRRSSKSHHSSASISCPMAKEQETLPRPTSAFIQEHALNGYVHMPRAMTKFLGKRRRRYGGNDNMQYYITSNLAKPWLHLEELEELKGKSSVDKTWIDSFDDVPCFDVENVHHGKVKKMSDKSKCGNQKENTRVFEWNNAYMMIADLEKCENEMSTEAEDFLKAAYSVCESSFGYHCVRIGEGIAKSYFQYAWKDCTHVALIVSDCAQTSQQEECSFLVLGFALLRNYSGHVTEKFVYNKRFIKDGFPMNHNQTIPNNVLYVDVVCSKFSMAQNLLRKLCVSAGKRGWKNIVFGDGADAQPHFVFLRAIPSVYTYYPIQYGFQRTIDNVKIHPIFKIPVDDIGESFKVLGLQGVTQDNIVKLFGQNKIGMETRWRLDEKDNIHVYKLGKEFITFQKDAGLFAQGSTPMETEAIQKKKRDFLKYYKFKQFVCQDSDSNGYLYGLYVQ